jgi:hypothetical protein
MEAVAQEFGVTESVRFNTGVSRLAYEKPAHPTSIHGCPIATCVICTTRISASTFSTGKAKSVKPGPA